MGDKTQRRVRNYLIDRRFQLKYTGMVLLVTVSVAGGLGYMAYGFSKGQTEALTMQIATQLDLDGDTATDLEQFALQEDRKIRNAIVLGVLLLPVLRGEFEDFLERFAAHTVATAGDSGRRDATATRRASRRALPASQSQVLDHRVDRPVAKQRHADDEPHHGLVGKLATPYRLHTRTNQGLAYPPHGYQRIQSLRLQPSGLPLNLSETYVQPHSHTSTQCEDP